MNQTKFQKYLQEPRAPYENVQIEKVNSWKCILYKICVQVKTWYIIFEPAHSKNRWKNNFFYRTQSIAGTAGIKPKRTGSRTATIKTFGIGTKTGTLIKKKLKTGT